MQKLEFENSKGKIIIGRGYKYTFVSFNPNDGDTEYQSAQYVDIDGEDIISSTYQSRELSFDGNIIADNIAEVFYLRRKLSSVMDGKTKGVLRYSDGRYQYFSECLAELPDYGEVVAQKLLPFTVTLNLYKFYWKAGKADVKDVYTKIKNLKSSFSFPCTFSTRSTTANITNTGDISAPMVITVTAKQINEDARTGYGFKIANSTTDKYLSFGNDSNNQYGLSDDEVITIDTDDMTITSSINGNVLQYMTADGDFFDVAEGDNVIECVNYDNTINITVTAEFYKRYVGV